MNTHNYGYHDMFHVCNIIMVSTIILISKNKNKNKNK